MAAVKFKKGSEEWMMFQSYYQIIQNYYAPDDTDEYWENVISEMDGFCKQYESVPLASKMALAFINTLEEEYKKGRK